ncbi:nickel-dependent lactate racemase [Candidatus Bathycorpusculum sp.]|jgi:nickel-dependent lactate racemase|uniref:nickel-dependent lactate racemase n=1 Tax=Candidatus Bathycorpusculum sp. TaxID=2994959 RepID=UPI0028298F6C|nr:nickel-dependent lactate racemase [Candidatus Termitimicrobium sp.]MCL2686261.1 nickel-dependent lactate racemase [Candidatus Termitimicrobium sp.]
MVDVWLPYGKTDVCVRIPARNLLGTIEPKEFSSAADQRAEIERALREPFASKCLSEIVKPESKVAIVIDESTPNMPSAQMLLLVLNELNTAGVRDENITVILGYETYPLKSEEDQQRLDQAVKRVRVVNHDVSASDLVYIGTTKTHGNKVHINRFFAEADVRVLLGDVQYHDYAGYGGGRKSVLPAIAGLETIRYNHALLVSASSTAGNLENNPVHIDMTEAARLSKVDFIVNVVENKKGEIVRAFAGDLEAAFLEAAKLVDEIYCVMVDRRADIIVVSAGGHPGDLTLYQALKAMETTRDAVKRGGVIILVAECLEGYGNQVFYDWMTRLSEIKNVEREVKRNFAMGGQRAYYLLKTLLNQQIILVSAMPDFYATSIFKLKTARAINDALNEAFKTAGSASRVWAMPLGNKTLPVYRSPEDNKA